MMSFVSLGSVDKKKMCNKILLSKWFSQRNEEFGKEKNEEGKKKER